ncbi:MAG: hypothetical protein GEU74_03150 [Nitriliruptorales bacterium]|nr:hypothetical protein [Nitriliruptorales bacterium]
MLYRSARHAAVLTTLAAAGVGGGALHAHGPALLGDEGDDVADAIANVAADRGVTAMVWDGDSPTELAAVHGLAREVSAALLVVEWQPAVAGGDALAREVLGDPPCDVLLVRPAALEEINQVTVAIGPGPNAPLLAGLAQQWGSSFDVPATVLHRVDTDDDVGAGRLLCKRLAPELPAEIVVGRDLTNLLSETAARTGFVALGATEHVAVDRVAARTGAGQLARKAGATIVIGRTRSG